MQWLSRLKAYGRKEVEPVVGMVVGIMALAAVIATVGTLAGESNKPAPPTAHPPIHLVTITIDQITVTVPIFGTNVEFKVQ